MLFSHDIKHPSPLRQSIRDSYRMNENTTIEQLVPLAHMSATDKSKAWNLAREIVEFIRLDSKGQRGVDALLQEFSLSSEEGVVLMCLAEALLRIPDKHTQDALIKDKLVKGNWGDHLGNSDSLFVNASSWALLLTGKMVSYNYAKTTAQVNLLKKSIGRLGEPVIRRSVNVAMRVMGKQFVTGRTIKEALERSNEAAFSPYRFSFDMLGEAARTMDDAEMYYDSYLQAIHAIGVDANGRGPEESPGISIKLSAIHPRYAFTQRERVMSELAPKLKSLAVAAKGYNIGFTVDAEEADRLDISLDVIESVFMDKDLDGWEGFGLAVQAYQKRAITVIDWLADLSERAGKKMMVRLVKGAYWDSEIKHAQQMGFSDFPVFTRKQATDLSYLAAARKLLDRRDCFFPQFGTHNALTAASIIQMTVDSPTGYEFQRLHGMGESLFAKVLKDFAIPCRIYAPVGVHEDLLAYLVRRLLENGANSSFINAILDENKPLDTLLSDPFDVLNDLGDKYHPLIAMPADLFLPERTNSKGFDETDAEALEPFQKVLLQQERQLLSVVAESNDQTPVRNPADLSEIIGYIDFLDVSQMQQCIDNAETAFASWSATPVDERAHCLLRLADLLEENREELVTLCIKEAGKVLSDAIDEIREAVDFCRYYAHQAMSEKFKDTKPRGVVLCVSPWNFPLAIFLGQVGAAMVMGNTVLAKAAEQTTLIAKRTLALLHEAGMPQHVIQLVIAHGRDVGEHIVTDPRISAVMFTGSTATGQLIARTLAERPAAQVPLVAETGGQNCMIVDSTALLEQVVDDVISSGFQSAGQRCSALRVLYVQEDIAENLIQLLVGAMKELKVSDPKWLSTDIGPVIDDKAMASLTAHVDYLEDKGRLLYTCEPIDIAEKHHFFAPRLYEIADISVLQREVFGPCVHIVRFRGDEVEQVVNRINATGFGLTMGVHTRIEDRAIALANASNAGNIYINRNMIGAVVGAQPFGGHGLSGTGPKAGGPHYLGRLVQDLDDAVSYTGDTDKVDDGAKPLSDVNALFEHAAALQGIWKHLPLDERIIAVRQLGGIIAESEMAHFQHLDVDQTLHIVSEYLLKIKKEFGHPVLLPGPTGEANSLHLSARGCILNYANTETSFLNWMTSLLVASALGNTSITIVSDSFYSEAMRIFNEFNAQCDFPMIQLAKKDDLTAILNHPDLKAVIISSECRLTHFITKTLAGRDGAILPVINAASHRLAEALVLEKTMSIDTTASGGNAALMAMEE